MFRLGHLWNAVLVGSSKANNPGMNPFRNHIQDNSEVRLS